MRNIILAAFALALTPTLANATDITGVPKIREGDQVMIGSTRIGMERLVLLIEELGVDKAPAFFEAVLVNAEGQVIGEGHTQRAGEAHAEIMALRQAQAAGHDLRKAERENVALQSPEPRGVEFQPDEEQEQGDAELGDAHLRFGVADQADDHELDARDQQHRNHQRSPARRGLRDQRLDRHRERAAGCGRLSGVRGTVVRPDAGARLQ